MARKKKIKKLQASSSKLQAALTMDLGYSRMIKESEEIMKLEKEINGHLYITNDNLKRIADAIEEILRLVKKDMEPKKK